MRKYISIRRYVYVTRYTLEKKTRSFSPPPFFLELKKKKKETSEIRENWEETKKSMEDGDGRGGRETR